VGVSDLKGLLGPLKSDTPWVRGALAD
jgi:hypothetical protein